MIRPYPVQRQMWPSSAFAIASRSSLLPCSMSDAARTTMPGMQKPHWTPPSSTKASPMVRRRSAGTPSSVTISWPSICSGLRRHDKAGRPSIITRQQPHAPSGAQPFFADTTPHSSRRTSSRCIPVSYVASVGFPFSVNRMVGMPSGGPLWLLSPPKTIVARALDGLPEREVTSEVRQSEKFLFGGYMQEPWKTDKWFISPWNYLPEVTKNYSFPPNIKIHDVTLRDGEQQTAVVFRREEKVAIAKKLDALGVHRIEAGMPAVSPQDRAAISDIAALGLRAEIFGFARCIPSEVKVVKECGCTGIVIEIPASDHMIQNGYGWPIERAMKASIETTLAAKEAGLYTVFFTIDSTRTELNRFLDIVDQVATEGHMDSLTMADTMGGTTPDAYAYVVKKVIERLKKPVEAHCHMDFGLGVANTVAALQAGASVAHTTVTGLGERAGNVPTEDVVMSLLCLYGKDLGIKTRSE